MVAAAIAEGYRHIDTSEYYGNEEPVGEAIRSSPVPRDDLWVTTKILHPKAPRPHGVRAAAEASLARLGLEHVDAMLIHWPNDHFEFEHELEVFMELRDAGLTRTIGVSNFPSALLRAALGIDPDIVMNQVEFHPFLSQTAVMEVAAEAGVLVTAHSPLARGAVLEDPGLRYQRSGLHFRRGWLPRRFPTGRLSGQIPPAPDLPSRRGSRFRPESGRHPAGPQESVGKRAR